MDLNSLFHAVSAALPAVIWTFGALAALDDGLDLAFYAKTKKSWKFLADPRAVAAILAADLGTRTAFGVLVIALTAGLAGRQDPFHVAVAAAALAAGASTIALKSDVRSKIERLSPQLGSILFS